MVKCSGCARRVNSAYIREGLKGIMRKVGFYCSSCDIYYDLRLKKLYTVNSQTVYSHNTKEIKKLRPIAKLSIRQSLGRDLDPGPLPYQGNALPG